MEGTYYVFTWGLSLLASFCPHPLGIMSSTAVFEFPALRPKNCSDPFWVLERFLGIIRANYVGRNLTIATVRCQAGVVIIVFPENHKNQLYVRHLMLNRLE